MKLALKKSLTGWKKIQEFPDGSIAEAELKHLSIPQWEHFQELYLGDTKSGINKVISAAQYGIKYAIKNWRTVYTNGKVIDGLVAEDGSIVKCILKNNELEDDLWWSLVSDTKEAQKIFMAINEEIEFLEVDKKKIIFAGLLINSGKLSGTRKDYPISVWNFKEEIIINNDDELIEKISEVYLSLKDKDDKAKIGQAFDKLCIGDKEEINTMQICDRRTQEILKAYEFYKNSPQEAFTPIPQIWYDSYIILSKTEPRLF